MNKHLFSMLVFCFLLLQPQLQAQSRIITNFDSNWSFYQGDASGAEKPDFNDNAWRKLNVPHDWSIEGENLKDNPGGGTVGFFPTGVGWYRKSFNISSIKSDERYQIEFDGVYMNSTVWLNGKLVGNYPYGYSSFVHDLTLHRTS